jgi:hypothetical protein
MSAVSSWVADDTPVWVESSTPVATSIDSAVFTLLFAAIALPFPEVFFLRLGFVTLSTFELVYGCVGGLLFLKILVTGRIRRAGLALLFFGSLAVYVLGSVAAGWATLGDALRQARFYWPFALAVLLLSTGTTATLRKFWRYLFVAAALSAGSAFVLHYWLGSYVENALAAAPDAVTVIQAGRMYWANAAVTLFVLLYYVIPTRSRTVNRALGFVTLVLTLAATFNTLNRTFIAGVILLGLLAAAIAGSWSKVLRRLSQMVAVTAILAAIVGGLMSVDARFHDLVVQRYLGGEMGAEAVYESSGVPRLETYQQYFESIKDYFPLGQGLGRPFSSSLETAIYTTDSSVLTFVLPFGVLGLVILGAFVGSLWRLLSRNAISCSPEHASGAKLLIVSSLLISLNIDLYSRNNFVVLMTLLVLCCGNRARPAMSPENPSPA